MIHFFQNPKGHVYAVQTSTQLSTADIEKLNWLFGQAQLLNQTQLTGTYLAPRVAIISPWSTNAVEITQNIDISGIHRIEEFKPVPADFEDYDHMNFQKYSLLDQEMFTADTKSEDILDIDDIATYNEQEGLALSSEEVDYLNSISEKIGRKLTDSEVFGFSQANSEHCRHKIFNGRFIIDGEEKETSLFKLIKKTSATHPNEIVSAYKDNVAFIQGPKVTQFAPQSADKPDFYTEKDFESVLSLKAETHNFPTTVEPYSGGATGSGGEIRDRLAGGQGSVPMAGFSVYMTAYSRLNADRPWEQGMSERDWLYQSPIDILIKASNGASDFGNKFGQPLITGSILTFEHDEQQDGMDHARKLGFDKVIMLAGGVGYGKKDQALKKHPQAGDKIVVMGGDNYRIGMGGAAGSSGNTGVLSSSVVLNTIQRSNPEIQKRVANAIQAMIESDDNPIVSIHDHGAGGHLNCLTELVEETGGRIDMDKLPVGDSTLSDKEIIGNESQERMGLVITEKDLPILEAVAERERAPLYVVGEVSDDHRFVFQSKTKGSTPMDYDLGDFFGSTAQTTMEDHTVNRQYAGLNYESSQIPEYLRQIFKLEAVASKTWLTSKVDRCGGGRVAKQQTVGTLQLPLNNVGVMALDFSSTEGIATAIGHSPLTALVDPAAGSRNAIAETLSNMVFAPIKNGIEGISLSANWMWPCNNEGEDARLYQAVQACSDFAIALGINIPTGKDSLSMKQKYPNGDAVLSPGTVIISAVANCTDFTKVVEPVLQTDAGSIYYIKLSQDTFQLGGSSFAQTLNKIGNEVPDIKDADYFVKAFNTVQGAIAKGLIAAGHDIGSGGLITSLMEMCFADLDLCAHYDLSSLGEQDSVKVLFNENIGLVLQAKDDLEFEAWMQESAIEIFKIGNVDSGLTTTIKNYDEEFVFNVEELRDAWMETSFLLDQKQTDNNLAEQRFINYKLQTLKYQFPKNFSGKIPQVATAGNRPKAAILREKGSNSEREMAHALYLAGFDVKDVHMTDIVSGREDLKDVQFLAAVGGSTNSDVLGAGKGWAAVFKYNERAQTVLKNFFDRPDTMSLGICNGGQMLMELDLIYPEHETHGKLRPNQSGRFECGFISVKIQESSSIMMKSLEGCTLGIWAAHGKGNFGLPHSEDQYHISAKYLYSEYPGNPNGSDYNTAMLCDDSGRHLVSMPHFERSIFQWNWADYPKGRQDEVSPWIEAFVNARLWCEQQKNR